MCATPPRNKRHGPVRHRAIAFTLVELLVVIGIIALLVGAVLVAGSSVLNSGRVRSTRAVLQVIEHALDEFKRSEEAKPTITRAIQGPADYRKRYGQYPPDELELFTPYGIPGSRGGGPLTPGADSTRRPVVVPTASAKTAFAIMDSYLTGKPEHDALEHRDLAAMLLTIELYATSAAEVLSHIPNSNWSDGPVDAAGKPVQFLDRNRNGAWDPQDDERIRYLVDAWGVPLSYLAQRDWNADLPVPSSNHPGWQQASTEIIRLNRDRPLVFSYGPDGKEQLTKTWMEDEVQEPFREPAAASLVGDWIANQGRIAHQLNQDNVYLEAELNERLARGKSDGL